MTELTSSLVSSETSLRPLTTRETVAIETPARSAISRIVTREGRCATSVTVLLKQFSGTFRKSVRRGGGSEHLRTGDQALDLPPRAVVNVSGNFRPSAEIRPPRPNRARKDIPKWDVASA